MKNEKKNKRKTKGSLKSGTGSGDVISIKMGVVKRLRLWWAAYKKRVTKRLNYLEKRARE